MSIKNRGYFIHEGSPFGKELDFVAEKQGAISYIQVAATVKNPAVLRRKQLGLEDILAKGKKILLTMDKEERNYGDMEQKYLISWLLEEH